MFEAYEYMAKKEAAERVNWDELEYPIYRKSIETETWVEFYKITSKAKFVTVQVKSYITSIGVADLIEADYKTTIGNLIESKGEISAQEFDEALDVALAGITK